MTRRLQVALTLVLYAAAMALVWWALKAWMPTFDIWTVTKAGKAFAWGILFVSMAIAALVRFWPRNQNGSMRSVLPRQGRR